MKLVIYIYKWTINQVSVTLYLYIREKIFSVKRYSLLRSSNRACRSASASVVPAPPPSATAALPFAAGAKEPTKIERQC